MEAACESAPTQLEWRPDRDFIELECYEEPGPCSRERLPVGTGVASRLPGEAS